MSVTDDYRVTLRTLGDWDEFLRRESRLPGPRGNLELARAVAEEGDEALFARLRRLDAETAPTNTPEEFLAFCGVLGLGKLLAAGRTENLGTLQEAASDPRWRIREAVAMALQRYGATHMDGLLHHMDRWSRGNLLEQRAAAAALCEPNLLRQKVHAKKVLGILDEITASLEGVEDRKQEDFKVLRKGLGYCWSVAVAVHPEAGKRMLERWLGSEDRDVRWIMRQNLKKKRLTRMDAEWVAMCLERLGRSGGR